MTATLSLPFKLAHPLYSGSSPAAPDVPGLYPVALGGHGYVIDLALFERQTVARFRNPYDQSQEPGEHSLNTLGPWLRSAARWDHGAGQTFWDNTDSDRFRFRSSKGIDPWTLQNRVQLLPDTRNIRSSVNTNLELLLAGGYLYCTDGTEVYFTADPTGATPSWSSASINIAEGAQTVNDITTDGAVVYAAVGTNGIHKTTVGATSSSHLSATAADLVEYANGRLIAAAANVLSEIDSAGTATTIKSHAISSFSWQTVMGAPNGIYAAGNAGDRAEIYFIGLKSDGTLAPPVFAGSLPDGETINVLAFYNGVVVLGTSLGLRLGQVTNADGISYGNAVEITNGVACVEPQSSYVWFGWKNYDATSTGLGRASLANLTDSSGLVPAYASDLMATTQGTVLSAATFGTKRYFAVSGHGVYAEYATLVASGTLNSGWVNDTTGERKIAISVDLRHEPLAGSVAVALESEDGTVFTLGSNSTADSLSPSDPFSAGSRSSESFEVQLTLTRSSTDNTTGPVLRRWTMRSLVTPNRVDEIMLPIILRRSVRVSDVGDGHDVAYDPLAEWLYLKSLENTGAPVVYQQGTESELAYIEQVMLAKDETRQWTNDRSFPEGICMVHLVTLNPAA